LVEVAIGGGDSSVLAVTLDRRVLGGEDLEGFASRDARIEQALRLALAELLSERLEALCGFVVEPVRIDTQTTFIVAPRPLNLLGFMWMWAARHMDASADLRVCDTCKETYDAWDKVNWGLRKNRSPRSASTAASGRHYCSNACRQRAYRERKATRGC